MEEVNVDEFITMTEAMQKCEEIGMKMNRVTLLRVTREKEMLYQPRGKNGKCWIKKARFEKFLKTGL